MSRPVVALLAAALVLTSCSTAPKTEGRQVSVRIACQDLVRDKIGQAAFRDTDETWTTSGGSTTYKATGSADTTGRSYRYACTGTVDSTLTLTTRIDTLE